MSIEAGQMLLHYRLVEKLGEGGMGVVWKAVDTTLDREVAIKVLPDLFSQDAERLARFEREAKLVASLNHTGIAVVHGLHEVNGMRFLAMEFVPGEDLSARLAQGPLPVNDALFIAVQVAEALEAAHAQGVVHRDLKPANIMLTPDGKAKVLDFGLAKAYEADGSSSGPSTTMSPTVTSAGTVQGMILGTAAYMSPEQARGKPLDRRTDIWSFGCVLFECLSGAGLYRGESVSDSLGAILHKEPDWSLLPPETPPTVRLLLRRCLAKEARKRLHDVADARIELEQAIEDPQGSVVGLAAEALSPAGSAGWRGSRVWLAVAAILLAAGAFAAGRLLRGRPGAEPPVRLAVELSATETLARYVGSQIAVSPDGSRLAYAMGDPPKLHIRNLEHLEDTTLSGTEDATNPFFSPDGEWVAFFADSKLKKVSVHGGAPLTLAEAGLHRGGTWGDDDTIVFTPTTTAPLHRIPAAGGEPEPITTLADTDERRERSHRWPHYLPGAKAVLFCTQEPSAGFDEALIEALDIETGKRTVVHRGGCSPRYVEGGFLVFARAATLFAVRFDPKGLKVTGAPVPVLEGVSYNDNNGGARYSFSRSGTMVYVSGQEEDNWTSNIIRFDRAGEATKLPLDEGAYRSPSISPDQAYMAFASRKSNASDIWIYDLRREVPSRLTFAEAGDWRPSWTPDGSRIVFSSDRNGSPRLFTKPADGSGEVRALTPDWETFWNGADVSPDGTRLVVTRFVDSNDLALLDLDQEGAAPEVFLSTEAHELGPVFSPDGRWIAYVSNESGTREIYVRPFPGPGGQWQISRAGGTRVRWSRDGRELFFLQGTTMMAVSVSGEGTSFQAGRPQELFSVGGRVEGTFDVLADGSFLAAVRDTEDVPEVTETVVAVIFNWPTELDRRVP